MSVLTFALSLTSYFVTHRWLLILYAVTAGLEAFLLLVVLGVKVSRYTKISWKCELFYPSSSHCILLLLA